MPPEVLSSAPAVTSTFSVWAKPVLTWWNHLPFGIQWPLMLWLLALLPLMAWWLGRQRRSTALWGTAFATPSADGTTSVEPAARPRASRWFSWLRLPLAAWLVLAGLAALFVASSRPQAVLTLPSLRQDVMLAIDMSGSMRAADIAPNRFTAAKEAAKGFVADMPRHTRVGIVALAGTALVVQPLTDDREQLTQALDNLQLQRGTALGSGIVVALATLLPDAKIDTNLHITGRPTIPSWMAAQIPAEPKKDGAKKEEPKKLEPGDNRSAAIVLVTDGMSNLGPEPLKMAQLAADYGVRVFTVGVGTPKGAKVSSEGWAMQVRLEEDGLKKLATVTAGEYFRGASAAELQKVYDSLSLRLQAGRKEKVEVSALFALLGALLFVSAAAVSLARTGRVA
jgi:Ca-activated chloride channel homolog